MTYIKICIDLDSTLWRFMPSLIEKYNKDNNSNLQLENFIEYNFSQIVNMTTDEFFGTYADEDFFKNLKPYRIIYEFVEAQHECPKNEIYFVTSCSPYTAPWRYNRLQEIFPWITKENFIICSHKWIIDYDILIDDNIDNFKRKDKVNILINRPWNINKIGSINNISRITVEEVIE